MGNNTTAWVIDKLKALEQVDVVERTPEDFLILQSKKTGYTFISAVLGVQNLITLSDVEGLFTGATKPQFIVNVPSKTLWDGHAIKFIHAKSAAFGKLGDLSPAALTGDAGSYRDKNMGFFIKAMEQHSNVSGVSYVYSNVFRADRKTGKTLIIAVIDAYNMSAEDVRNAKTRFGYFDVIIKSSSYGSITKYAETAAQSMGAEALTFGELMSRLGR